MTKRRQTEGEPLGNILSLQTRRQSRRPAVYGDTYNQLTASSHCGGEVRVHCVTCGYVLTMVQL